MSSAVSSWGGIFTPLVTPVGADGAIDLESLGRLVDFQVEQGVHGLWVLGTTGEFAAFDRDERAAAVEAVVRRADGRVPVIANVSDAATRLVIRHAQRAEAAGADAIAATPPFYYPHSQHELLDHYRSVALSTRLPLFMYNIPQTVGVALALPTAIQLTEENVVAGIKDSQNNLEWFRELTLRLGRVAPAFRAFAGTRHLIDAAILAGGIGAIPNLANVYPELCVRTFEAASAGDYGRANESQSRIVEIESELKSGKGSRNANIIGRLKQLLHCEGIIACPEVTAPLYVD